MGKYGFGVYRSKAAMRGLCTILAAFPLALSCCAEEDPVPFPVEHLRAASPGAPLRSAPAIRTVESRETEERETARGTNVKSEGDRKVATFSICAVDPQRGVCGAAVASKYPAVGRVVPYARAGVGAFCTQHHHVPAWGEPALDALAAGKSPQTVLADLLADEAQPGLRQLGIINMTGRTAQHNPTEAPPQSRYWGAQAGRYYCCQGNTLTGREVITAMARAYEETRGSLADRLIAALVAADCAGGDHRGRLAAGIRVAKTGVEGYWFELYVDQSDDAVIDLLRKYAELDHEAKGAWRGGRLPFVHPCPDRPASEAPREK
jgi:uncharacterized Ntn-hydrolase superfamily protein